MIDWEAVIERIRAEEAPLRCPTCASTTPAVIEQKWCSTCRRDLPILLFGRNRARHDGRNTRCSDCNKAYTKQRRTILARQAGGLALVPVNHRKAAGQIGVDALEYHRQIESGKKWCSGHKVFEPRDRFGARASKPDGLNNVCLEAARDRDREAMRRRRSKERAA